MMEYRCYTFGNMYLSSIQQGIQAAHAITEMFVRYEDPSDRARAELMEWARKHKTMVCLNAGAEDDLLEVEKLFNRPDHSFAWAPFREEGLGSSLTCIAIIIPSRIYEIRHEEEFAYNRDLESYLFEEKGAMLDKFEFQLLLLLQHSKLAR